MNVDVGGFKEGQRRMWSAGDYPELSRSIASVGALVAERATAGAGAGVELLDVATGSGNVALPAAAAGATVTGLDLTPKLLEVARERAATAGLEIDFIEGDAESLPFAEDSFDSVTSCFGVIFAPRHQLAADELTRVARPGASIVLAAWTPEGLSGRMFTTVASYMPPPPPGLEPSVAWGVEDHVSSLFAASGAQLAFERHTVTFEHDSTESWLEHYERTLGPTILAKGALEPQGKWEPLREELLAMYQDGNEATDGSFRARAEYLLTTATLPA